MDYFLIMQDHRIPNLVEPIDTEKKLRNTENYECPALNQFLIKENEHPEYVDYIENPVPVVSDQLKQILERFERKAQFSPVVLTDLKQGAQHLYWQLNPPKVRCSVNQTEFNKDGTIKKLVIAPELVANFRLFEIDQVTEKFILMNLIVVESMLRRGYTGFRFTKVEVATNR